MTISKIPAENIYIVSGLSGAGKSTALRVFEDMNYFVVDGLPINMISYMIDMMKTSSMGHFKGIALGLDMRQEDFLRKYDQSIKDLAARGIKPHLIFLEADSKNLIQRYATTRRLHPLEKDGVSLEKALMEEHKNLAPLRKKADYILNTSNFSIHDLRRLIQQKYSDNKLHSLRVNVISFGFKHNIPSDADMVFDLRFLPNPFFVEELRPLDGRNEKVANFIFSHTETKKFHEKLLDLLILTLKQMNDEGRYRVTIAFGCTGGKHRSVAFAQDIGSTFSQMDYPVLIEHRHINLE